MRRPSRTTIYYFRAGREAGAGSETARRLVRGLIDLMGENKAAALQEGCDASRVEAQKKSFSDDAVTAAGEHDLFIDGYIHNAVESKPKARRSNMSSPIRPS